jgi:signal transduction histidine kinase
LINLVIGSQVERMRRNDELMRELARKERLAAIGELSARALHHTRHQMGLVGMIAHQIARRLDGLPASEAGPIREELAKLKAVQEDLQHALLSDLDGKHTASAASESLHSYEELIRAQSARLQPLADDRAIELRLDVAAGLPSEVRPHSAVKLGQALQNVIENAIAAATSQVLVRLALERGAIVISVLDDGPGMDEALLARASEPFVTTKPSGSGMGLAITRAVVEEEDGVLELTNRAEGGLLVHMRLPSRSRVAHESMP